MQLFALGINHRSANLALREQFAFTAEEAPEIVQSLRKNTAVEEAVVLSTCNRTEIYTVAKCHHAIKEWLRAQHHIDQAKVGGHFYEHLDLAMIKHLMSVASGLDSMILGEPQIFGQLKQAYQVSLAEGAIGQHFSRLFPAVFETAKLVRNETDIGRNAVTMAYAVIQLAKQTIQRLEDCTVFLLGAGETVELIANYLSKHKVGRLVIVSRTLEKAHRLARDYSAVPLRFEELDSALPEADLIISATTSSVPVLLKNQVEQAMLKRQNRPLFIADLAVPRDVDLTVAELANVKLYNIDDLQSIVSEGQRSRQEAASRAREIIEVQSLHYLRELRVHEAGDMIRAYRQKMYHWRDEALEKALSQLDKNQDPAQVITELARNLTNKFIHHPTEKMRVAAYAEHDALAQLIKELYSIPEKG